MLPNLILGGRSKERYFSPRNTQSQWDVDDQPLEFWKQRQSDFDPTHLRIHPLLDWTKLKSSWPCIQAVQSNCRNVEEIILEVQSGKSANIAERAGRAQDKSGGGPETLQCDGYI